MSEIYLTRTDAENIDFKNLSQKLSEYHKQLYGQYCDGGRIKYVVIAYEGNVAIGCGALRLFNEESMEIKRFYVAEEYRRKGIASRILVELESWIKELGFKKAVLETGKKQEQAINFYKKNNYVIVPNLGENIKKCLKDDLNLCFIKELTL